MAAILTPDFDAMEYCPPTPPAPISFDCYGPTTLYNPPATAPTHSVPSKLPARYAAPAAAYAASRAGGNAPYRLTDVITVNVPNPKRPGTNGYLRYSLWHTGMTVAAYLDALETNPNAIACRGYGPTDLTYNLKRGLISVSAG